MRQFCSIRIISSQGICNYKARLQILSHACFSICISMHNTFSVENAHLIAAQVNSSHTDIGLGDMILPVSSPCAIFMTPCFLICMHEKLLWLLELKWLLVSISESVSLNDKF